MNGLYRVVCVIALAGSMLSGCATNVPFDFFQEGYKPRAGSLAVVSGGADDSDIRFSDFLTRRLQEKSTLKVLSQDEVDRRVGKYPVNIKIAEPKDSGKPVWFAPGEKARVDAMHGALKTDYVLVVWVTNISRYSTRSSVNYGASIVGNLVDYSPSSGKTVGYSDFGRSRSQSCFLFGGSEGKDIDTLLRFSAEELADEFMDRTHTGKK